MAVNPNQQPHLQYIQAQPQSLQQQPIQYMPIQASPGQAQMHYQPSLAPPSQYGSQTNIVQQQQNFGPRPPQPNPYSYQPQGISHKKMFIFQYSFAHLYIFRYLFILGMGPGMSQPSGMGSQYGYPQMQQHMTVQPQYVQAAVAIPQQQQPMQSQLAQAASQSGVHAGSDGSHPPVYMAAPQQTGWAPQSQQPGQPSHYAAVSLAQSSIGQPIQPQQVALPGILCSFLFLFKILKLFCFFD